MNDYLGTYQHLSLGTWRPHKNKAVDEAVLTTGATLRCASELQALANIERTKLKLQYLTLPLDVCVRSCRWNGTTTSHIALATTADRLLEHAEKIRGEELLEGNVRYRLRDLLETMLYRGEVHPLDYMPTATKKIWTRGGKGHPWLNYGVPAKSREKRRKEYTRWRNLAKTIAKAKNQERKA